MKIKPDYKGRNDGYDKSIIRYYEKIEEEEYFYEIYVLINRKKCAIVVTNNGVSIDFGKNFIHTNIVPSLLFKDIKYLEWEHLDKIIKILEATDIEGVKYKTEEKYQKWISLGCP